MSNQDKHAPLKVGMLGLSVDTINQGEWGYVYLPLGPRDATVAGGREWVRFKVRALEAIRAERDIIVANAQGDIKEHTPVELSYEKSEGGFQRVTEDFPLPTTAGSKAITYVTVEATASGNTALVTPTSGKKVRVHYFSYSNKDGVVADVGMRFGSTGDIKHRFVLAASGGSMNANLVDANWEGSIGESLYAYLDEAHTDPIYVTVGYSEE